MLFPAHTVCVSYPANGAGGSVILADREARIDANCQVSAVFIAAGAVSGDAIESMTKALMALRSCSLNPQGSVSSKTLKQGRARLHVPTRKLL